MSHRLPDADTERTKLLERLDAVGSEALAKIEEGRIRDKKTEEVRCQQWRTVAYVVDIQRRILSDQQKPSTRVSPGDSVALPDGGEQ